MVDSDFRAMVQHMSRLLMMTVHKSGDKPSK